MRRRSEERRLAHVAFSRPRKRLVITYVRGEMMCGKWRAHERSSILVPPDIFTPPPRPLTALEHMARARGKYQHSDFL